MAKTPATPAGLEGVTVTELPVVGDGATPVIPTVAPALAAAVPFDAENPLPYFQSFDEKLVGVEAIGGGTFRARY